MVRRETQLESVDNEGVNGTIGMPDTTLSYTYNSAGQISTLSANIAGTPDFINYYDYNSANELWSLEQTDQSRRKQRRSQAR